MMPLIDNTVIFFYFLSCTLNAIYYFWVAMLLVFPPVYNTYEGQTDIESHDIYLVIPCLNEEKVISRTIHNILSMNLKRLFIVAINDHSEDDTLKILEGIKSDRLMIINRELPNARQGKGEALNDAYQRILQDVRQKNLDSDKVIVGIIDADTFIKPSLLFRVNQIFHHDKKAGMVQARVRIGISTRDTLLPFLQDIEFFSYINRMQNVREYMGTVAAAGNGQFNRLSAMEDLGEKPWSKCLLEDFDFSLRMLLKGWRTRLLQDENVYQQGVISYRKFIRQRTRWIQGSMQCFPYIKDIIRSKPLTVWGKAEILYFLLLPVLSCVSTIVLFVSWLLITTSIINQSTTLFDILAGASTFEQTALLAILLTIVYIPGIVFSILYWRDTRERFFRCLLAGLIIPLYNVGSTQKVIRFRRPLFHSS